MSVTSRLIVLTAVLVLGTGSLDGQASGTEKPVKLSWAFVQSTGGQARALDFTVPPVVRSGEGLRLYIMPAAPLFLYILLFDSQKKLTILFPEEYGDAEADTVVIPSLGEWLILDEVRGIEEFTILASATRLPELERLAKDLQKKEDAEKQARILELVKELKRSRSSSATAGEKGVTFAGTFQTRSSENIQGKAVSVSTMGLYIKTLSLRHE